jgi:RNA-binding protein 26
MPMFPPGLPFGMGPPATYDPHEARIDMRPGAPSGPMGRVQRGAMPPRVNGDGQPPHLQASGELPVIQDLTPVAYNDEPAQQPDKPPGSPSVDSQPNGISTPTSPSVKMEVDGSPVAPSSFPVRPHRGLQNSPARGRGGRPGVFGGDVQRFHPERRDKTLVVEKIPEDKLSLDAVNGWFKRFGTVTNVAVDAASAKALVSFSTHEEAHAAWKTEDAVFGNRFVKVFWHRPMDGQGLAGQRALAASAQIVASVTAREQVQTAPTLDAAPTDPPPSVASGTDVKKIVSTPSNSSASAFAARQKLLEQQIAEQKALMEKLNTASAEEKKEIFAQLRKLGQEIKTTSSQPTFTPSKKPSTSIPHPEDREAKERERLDKELELHSAVLDGEETTEALQAKLAKLKAEVRRRGCV